MPGYDAGNPPGGSRAGLEVLFAIADQQASAKPDAPWAATKPLIPLPHSCIVAMVPAYNEEEGIAETIESLLAQTRRPDLIVVIPNGCRDRTAEIARRYPVTVYELDRCEHKKSEALNRGWWKYARHADLVVCTDGDTVLPPHAVADWEAEFAANPGLGGSSSQPVMTGYGFLPRMQRNEFAKSAYLSLRRGWCRVISGTGCCYRGQTLRQMAQIPGQEGPWTYLSVVEDYHLTYQMRLAGWLAEMSRTVYCYTGSMYTLRQLWLQRIKWQSGTCGDLIRFGFNRRNWREWAQQGFGLVCIAFWAVWLALNVSLAATGHLQVSWSWLAFPAFFSVIETAHVRHIRPEFRDWKDYLLAASTVQVVFYAFISGAWIIASWWKVITNNQQDMWNMQYASEGIEAAVLDLADNPDQVLQELAR